MARILLLTGPSGAGKTTTAKRFLEKATGVWVYINQDEMRQLVKVGYQSADDYQKTWTEETQRQWDVSVPVCVDVIRRYNQTNINCLVDFFAPPDEFKAWKRELGDLKYDLVVLYPSEETTVQRNATRKQGRLKDNKIRTNHAWFGGWQEENVKIVANNTLDVDQTVDQLLNL